MVPYIAQGPVDPNELDGIARSCSSYVRVCRPLFERRVEAGRIREGHGVVLAEDIFVLDDGVRVLDCLASPVSARSHSVSA